MTPVRRKLQTWTPEETQLLTDLLLTAGRRRKDRNVYAALATMMTTAGYNRTAVQCRKKVEYLIGGYKNYVCQVRGQRQGYSEQRTAVQCGKRVEYLNYVYQARAQRQGCLEQSKPNMDLLRVLTPPPTPEASSQEPADKELTGEDIRYLQHLLEGPKVRSSDSSYSSSSSSSIPGSSDFSPDLTPSVLELWTPDSDFNVWKLSTASQDSPSTTNDWEIKTMRKYTSLALMSGGSMLSSPLPPL